MKFKRRFKEIMEGFNGSQNVSRSDALRIIIDDFEYNHTGQPEDLEDLLKDIIKNIHVKYGHARYNNNGDGTPPAIEIFLEKYGSYFWITFEYEDSGELYIAIEQEAGDPKNLASEKVAENGLITSDKIKSLIDIQLDLDIYKNPRREEDETE